jgi:hypothetical protein
MDDFLAWLAKWLGVSVADGAELQFELSSFPAGGMGLLVIAGILLIAVGTVFVYRHDGRKMQPWQRLTLAGLRIFALAMAVLLLLEPNLIAVKHETRQGHVILLVDTSQSMNQVDAFRRPEVQELFADWQKLGVADPQSATRADLLRSLLAHDDGALVRKLAAKNAAQLYGFAAGIDVLPLLPEPTGDPTTDPAAATDTAPRLPRIDVERLTSDGRYSNLGGSLRAALDKSRTSEIAAVVILGDGRRNAGPQAAEIARQLNQRKVPHTFVLGVGDPSETQKVLLARFETPEKVFQGDPFRMSAVIESQGYEPTAVAVTLRRIDAAGVESPVATRQVTVGGNEQETRVEFEDLRSEQTGQFTYRVTVDPPTGEAAVAERHQRDAPVEVLDQRTRVLLLAGGSSHEYQILRNQLIRDRTIDLTCWLQSADEAYAQDGNESVRIEALPANQQDFDPYDVAILIDPDPSKLTPAFCQMLSRHVVENGCGLWWVAGEKHSLQAFKPTSTMRPVVDLLPVYPDVAYAESKISGLGLAFTRSHTFELTPEGAQGVASKVTRIADGKRDESRILWSRLPGFRVAFPVSRTKPAATTVVSDVTAYPDLRRENRGIPLVATQFVGSGRVIYQGFDESYRWRSIYEEAYNWYWVQGIRYLFEGRLSSGNSRMKLLLSSEKIELGEALTISAEAKDEALQPLAVEQVELQLERAGEPLENLQLPAVEEAIGVYEAQLRPAQVGNYRLRCRVAGREIEAAFQVVPAQVESEGPVDRAELATIASANGAQLLDTPSQLLTALDSIPSRSATDTFRTPHAIWDSGLTVGLLLGALALEWLLRKRFNLL